MGEESILALLPANNFSEALHDQSYDDLQRSSLSNFEVYEILCTRLPRTLCGPQIDRNFHSEFFLLHSTFSICSLWIGPRFADTIYILFFLQRPAPLRRGGLEDHLVISTDDDFWA